MSENPNDSLHVTANFLSGRIVLYCPKCREHRRLSVQNRGIRIPVVDPHYTTGANKLRLLCVYCQTVLGYVFADAVSNADNEQNDSRWNRLELDENDNQ